MAFAASMAAVVIAGNFVLKTFTPSQQNMAEGSDSFAEMFMDAPLPQDYYIAEAEETVSEQDIVEFLINDMTTAEYLNYAENEKDY